MARRDTGEFSASSMADIAFLLLIFFLVTTTMDVDSGLSRKLPPPVEEEPEDTPPIKERNVFIVLINTLNQVQVEGAVTKIRDIKEKAKEFIANPENSDDLPQMELLSFKMEKAIDKGNGKEAGLYKKAIKTFGDLSVAKMAVISLQNDRGTSYKTYIEVQNELISAYSELRDELALKAFGSKYDELKKNEQKLVKKVYPQRISEAEPKNIGGK